LLRREVQLEELYGSRGRDSEWTVRSVVAAQLSPALMKVLRIIKKYTRVLILLARYR